MLYTISIDDFTWLSSILGKTALLSSVGRFANESLQMISLQTCWVDSKTYDSGQLGND